MATGFMRGHDDIVLGFYAKNAPKPDIDLRVGISIAEAEWLETKPILAVLSDFASLANSIIELFDYP